MKSAIIVLTLINIQVSILQNFRAPARSPLFTVPVKDPGCLTQQQRETALREFRNAIATNLSKVCGGIGWTRVAYLNMGDPMRFCPPDRFANEIRMCGRPAGAPFRCYSTIYSISGWSYSRVGG